MAGRPISEAKRAEILALHTQGLGCKAIAREAAVSPSTVSKICNEAGLGFDRSKTIAATRAVVADAKLRRAELAENLLADAARLREQLWQPARVINFGGKDNTLNETTLDEPLFADKLKIMQAVNIAAQRHEALVRMDTDQGQAAAESVLDRLAAGLATQATTQDPTP